MHLVLWAASPDLGVESSQRAHLLAQRDNATQRQHQGLWLRAARYPVKEHICWRREIMQLNGSTKGSGSEPQGIPLGPSPGAPFDDYRKAEFKEFLAELPLQCLDLPTLFLIVDVY